MAERGQADLTSVSYHITAPVIVAGEDTFELDRERDRTVVITPSRNFQNRAALQAIQSKPLEGFAAALHNYLLTAEVGVDIPALDYADADGKPAGSRPEYNERVLRAGWATLRAMCTQSLIHGDETAPDLPELPDLSCFSREASAEERENVYESALKAGLAIKDGSGNPVVWPDMEGRGTFVRAKELYGLIDSKRIDIKLPGRSRAMLAYFRERYEIRHFDGLLSPITGQPLYAALIYDLHLANPIQEGDVV